MAPCLSVRPSVRHKPVQIWKRLVELSRFLAILGYHEIVIRFGYLQNKDTSLQTLSDILDFENFAPRQVNRVANETRRRSSLWTTPTAHRGCLIHVGQTQPSNSITAIRCRQRIPTVTQQLTRFRPTHRIARVRLRQQSFLAEKNSLCHLL